MHTIHTINRIRPFVTLIVALWIPLSSVNSYTTYSSSRALSSLRIHPSVESSSRKCHSSGNTAFHASRYDVDKDSSKDIIPTLDDDRNTREKNEPANTVDHARRNALRTLALATSAAFASPALAGKPEFDKTTGELYSPKSEMLSGGSAAARGMNLEESSQGRLIPGQALQTVYDTRFIAYLSRFLLNFDPAANAWWVKNNAGRGRDTWELGREDEESELNANKFAEFAESVEIGLADYFVGPYGSYSSLQAAKAGIAASSTVRSARPDDPKDGLRILDALFMDRTKKERIAKDRNSIAKQGVLNLYTLLKARYTSVAAKRQLAILFSFFSTKDLQPTAEIQSLLGEADNATISNIELVNKPFSSFEATSRTSSRRGGGYTLHDSPTLTIEPPPALGASYKSAKAKPIMKPTSRVLRIRVMDSGAGYTTPPDVAVVGSGNRLCSACAVLDREGQIDCIFVLDPGYGYGKKKLEAPKVKIAPPNGEGSRRATAVAELEYEIVGLDIVEGGNGYVATEPPQVTISPPEDDPDWFVDVQDLAVLTSETGPIQAQVVQMRGPTGKLAYSVDAIMPPIQPSLDRIRKEPLDLLPSSVRPQRNSLGCYIIPAIAAFPTYSTSPNPRYRAVDPIFGAIGTIPAQKSALELKPSEYARLALSGAVCTVLVRTALNPLELIKTKLQLKNDEELLRYTRQNTGSKAGESIKDKEMNVAEGSQKAEEKIGALDLIFSMSKLRGPLALFQSADITFLASLVFGSFGFGATELFRRSFTTVFSTEGSDMNSEVILLLAATVATLITSAAAAPFELLRVRSMGLVESKKWTEILGDFLNEEAGNGDLARTDIGAKFSLRDVKPKDLLPLWAGFPPIASRELAFAIPKFLAFDILADAITGFFNSQAGPGSLPIQVGVGTQGLAISAISGALAGLAGAIVSHPADLILTYTSASKKTKNEDGSEDSGPDWREVVKELLGREGGIANLYVGLPPRLVFFFLIIGLQFFLYDYGKNLLQVGSDDLSLVLDVFYAVRQGLTDMTEQTL